MVDTTRHDETTVRMSSARRRPPTGKYADNDTTTTTDNGDGLAPVDAAPTELGAGGLLLPPPHSAGWPLSCHAVTGSPDCDLHNVVVHAIHCHWQPGAVATLAVLLIQGLRQLGWLPGLARAAKPVTRPGTASSSASARLASTSTCTSSTQGNGDSGRSSAVAAPVYETLAAVRRPSLAASVAGIAHSVTDAAVDVVWPAVALAERLQRRLSLTKVIDPFDGEMLDDFDADSPAELCLLRAPGGVASPAAWHSPGRCTSWESETADPLRLQFPGAAGSLSVI